MNKRTRASCDSLLVAQSMWTLSSPPSGDEDAGSSNCACCFPSKTRDPVERRPTLSLSDDESDASTHSPTSRGSGSSEDDAILSDGEMLNMAESQEPTPILMMEQSPINIRINHCDVTRQRKSRDRVAVSTSSGEADLEYTGDGFSVRWAPPVKNTLVIGSKVYNAVQFHFHTPSEHMLDGDHEAMELHLVHEASDGTLAVVAVFFREGKENPFLSQFWRELSGLKLGVAATIPLGTIDPAPLGLLAGSFFRYSGSLTTPPYTEGVEWVVIRDVAVASLEQLEVFRSVIPTPNARRVQPLHAREVTLVQ